MLGFFFKKNFYDGWDNLLFFFIPNLIWDVFLIAGAALIFAMTKIQATVPGIAVLSIAVLLIFLSGGIISVTWGEVASKIADFASPNPQDFFTALKSCIFDGIKYGFFLLILTVLTSFGFFYYFFPKNGEPLPFIGLLTGSIFTWIAISVYMAVFWYPSLRAQLHNKFWKIIEKCFVLFLDNIGICVVIGLYNLILAFISIVLIGIAPGMGGIGLARANLCRILLKKYDYIEEQKKADPKKIIRSIPWKEILQEDMELTGNRTFKSFLFSWKE